MRLTVYLLCCLGAVASALGAVLVPALWQWPGNVWIDIGLLGIFAMFTIGAQAIDGIGPIKQRLRTVGSLTAGIIFLMCIQLGYRACGTVNSECTTVDAINDRCRDEDER